MASIDKVLLDAETSDEFIKRLMGSVVLATKEANAVPQGSDYRYQSMSSESFRRAASGVQKEARSLISELCAFIKPGEAMECSEDVMDAAVYEQVVDVIDTLLEGADQFLEPAKASKLSTTVNQTFLLDKDRVGIQQTANVKRPQLRFLNDIDNARNTPFRPRLTQKYHAVVPLDMVPKRLVLSEEEEGAGTVGPDVYFPHPYDHELRNLAPPKWCSDGKDVKVVSPSPTYSQHPFTLVDTDAAFESMLQHLAGKDELAIDLEHHSMFTYQGLTCLLQLSTREQDFIVDALALRFRMKELGQFFADPTVVKVLHGCDKDVLWLQRDLGLYLVNCFDTHVAAKALGYPALSLAHLLKVHCGINADKKHQLSDWRVRELPPAMLHYANEDTRYLLYIYDRMRQELWKKLGVAGLEQVFNASKLLCLARYEKPRFNPLGYRDLFRETATGRGIPKLEDLTSLQESVLSALWDWRDATARERDDSCAAVMSNAELVRIGVHLPQSAVQLEQQCGPLSSFVRESTKTILRIVSDTTAVGGVGPSAAAPVSGAASSSSATVTTPSAKKAKGDANATKKPAAGEEAKVTLPASVYTFTPAILTTRVVVGRPASPGEQASPNLRTDEVFKQAGWSTPQVKADAGAVADSPLHFEPYRPGEISQENRARMQRSKEELAKLYNAELNNHLSRLATSPIPQARSSPALPATAESAAVADAPSGGDKHTVEVGGVAMDIPRSFEEVYKLSQRNRQRNKEKRRGAGGEDGEDVDGGMECDGTDEADEGMRSSFDKDDEPPFALRSGLDKFATAEAKAGKGKVDANFYLGVPEQSADVSVDSTLEFAQSVGWVKGSAHAAAIRESHYQDVSFQQAAGDGDEQGGSGALRRSGDKSSRGGAAGSGGSSGGIASQGSTKAFDYSKVPLTAMSALPAGSAPTGKDDRHGKDKKRGARGRGGGRGPSGDPPAAPSNPYMFSHDGGRK